jgi:hypothetical protein
MRKDYSARIQKRGARLADEVSTLREALKMDVSATEETWGEFAPQEVRDKMAAAALIHERLNYEVALRRLGFKFELEHNRMPRAIKALSFKIFGTPGVQEILRRITETEIEANTEAYVARLNQIALSDDDAEANRAIQSLARLGGLNKEKQITQVYAPRTNLFLMGQKGATRDSLDGGPKELQASEFLNHEPGEPERIFEVEEGGE